MRASLAEPDFDPSNEYATAALAPGEQRELEILVPTQDDLMLFGALIDAENSTPVADGVLQVEGDRWITSHELDEPDSLPGTIEIEGYPVRAGADGGFVLGGKSWKHRFVNAAAPGYARTAFPLAPGRTTPTWSAVCAHVVSPNTSAKIG